MKQQSGARMNHLVATALLSVMVTLPASLSAAQPASYGDAMRWYERKAVLGSAKAQFLLGLLYERGAGPREQDLQQAYKWFLKAADQGYPLAQFKVASALQRGSGVPKNLKLAQVWYGRAAKFSVVEAQYNLGYMMLYGEGSAPSPKDAARWYSEAARDGFGPAQLALGFLYLNGTGVMKDVGDAWAWFRAAESRDIAGALEVRKSTGADFSPDVLRRAEELAAPRLKK